MSLLTFPGEEAYEVWEVRETGGRDQFRATSTLTLTKARELAEQWTTEAEERFAAESMGPVKPVRRRFVIVKVTTTREAV